MSKMNVCFLLLSAFLSLFSIPVAAQPAAISVFSNGTEGYACYRIPAIIKSKDGQLLAFAEARKKDCNDFGDIDLVMKRSRDKGKTWLPLEVVIDNDTVKAGNPAPVVDLLDPRFPGGRIFLLYNTANGSESDARLGKGVREVWYVTSADGGKSWSERVNISTSVHKPLAPWYNPAYNFPEDWRTNALTPGHALQFLHGRNKGRIFIAANRSAGARKSSDDFDNYRAHCFFSDDHGVTWKLGAEVSIPGGNESTAAALSDGSVLQNIRYQNRNEKHRILAFSKTGGESWDTAYVARELPDPICQGSMISFPYKRQHLLFFSNPASQTKRERMTIRVSTDDGRSWPVAYLVDGGAAAYSDLVRTDESNIGLLYEKGNGGGIVYTCVPIKTILKNRR